MTAPNWPTVDDVPLHGDLPTPDAFWACTDPERPYDPTLTHWDWRCHGCFRHGEVTFAQHPDLMTRSVRYDGADWADDPEPLGWSVARARAWRGLGSRTDVGFPFPQTGEAAR